MLLCTAACTFIEVNGTNSTTTLVSDVTTLNTASVKGCVYVYTDVSSEEHYQNFYYSIAKQHKVIWFV